jgi:hypothetical protein
MTRVASLHGEQPRGIVFDVKNATPPLERALRKGNYHTRLCTRFFAESDLFDPGRWLSPGDPVLPTQSLRHSGFFGGRRYQGLFLARLSLWLNIVAPFDISRTEETPEPRYPSAGVVTRAVGYFDAASDLRVWFRE